MVRITNLPILPAVRACLDQMGDNTAIANFEAVGGGCIHRVYQVATEKRPYLVKWNPEPLPDIFEVEAKGLQLLAASSSVRVPEVLAINKKPDFILLEWIDSDGETSKWDQEQLGRQIAALHQTATPTSYGLGYNNYIGATLQVNDWHTDWVTFFRDCRLQPQMRLAEKQGALTGAQFQKLAWICDHLDRWIDEPSCQPSLLHGDLWAGNVICATAGQPVLIDPAVYFGDREAELAFTELFEGFTHRFYQAYAETCPLTRGYRERRDLYNLYHLLNHLNIFGTAYYHQVLAVINRYAGH